MQRILRFNLQVDSCNYIRFENDETYVKKAWFLSV